MGRKSMVEVRRDEITSAVQRCIVRHGLADTTMAMVAEEAGMQRSAISHFLGSREDVITAAIERSCDYYIDLILQVVGEVPPERAAEALVNELIGGKRAEPRAMVLFDEIITLARGTLTAPSRPAATSRDSSPGWAGARPASSSGRSRPATAPPSTQTFPEKTGRSGTWRAGS